jgi:uncharacterized protein (DUF1778 family)
MTSEPISNAKARISFRICPDQKELIQFAADLEGLSLSAFVVAKLQAAAEETISRHRVVTLSREGSISFAEALLNPSEPNEALRNAFRDYAEYFGIES